VSRAASGSAAEALLGKARDRKAVFGVVGLGYVGLPLAMELVRAGYSVIGFDLSARVVDGVNGGKSHVQDVPARAVAEAVKAGKLSATTDLARLKEPDAISICVPTPLSKTKDPDVSFVLAATESVKKSLRKGQLVVLESTTYPGTTRELLLPAFERTGLKVGEDFFLAFSPERVDPGNTKWNTRNTPKVLGGITPTCLRVATALYEPAIETLVPVSSTEAAELVRFSAVYSAQETTIHSDIAQFVQVTQSAGNRAIWSAAGNVATEIDSGDATIVATPHPADLQAALDKLVRGDRELTDGLRAIVHNLQPYNMAVRDVITQAISYRDGLAQDFSRQLAAEMRALGLSPPPSPF